MRHSPALSWYFKCFDFVSRERVRKNDLDLRIIHAHLTMVVSTGILMWAYSFLALKSFRTPVPGITGIACSLIHFLSPLLFLVTAKALVVCGIALAAGMIHQMTFAYYSGGFESCVLQWLPILPLLGGFIEGRRSLLLWTGITTLGIGAYFILHVIIGFAFPMLISDSGYHLAKGLLLFGWLYILFCTTWVHVSMKNFSEDILKNQGKNIDDLFRVLFHDLANSLGRINIGMSLCERELNTQGTKRGLQIIKDAQTSMSEITQNVRRMYAVSKGKAEVDLAPCALNSSVEHVLSMFAPEIEKKKLTVEYDFEKNRNIQVVVDPVSFNNQVLANILSNAIKFSHPGGVIRIQTDMRDGHVSIEIRDQGVGMPDVLMKGLFDMNKRTSRPGTSGESGTGFGMHIMKSFVEMYQGQVQVESSEAESGKECGTCIRLFLKGERAP